MVTAGGDFATDVVMSHQQSPALHTAPTAEFVTITEATRTGAPEKSFGGSNVPCKRFGLPQSENLKEMRLLTAPPQVHETGAAVLSNALWENPHGNI